MRPHVFKPLIALWSGVGLLLGAPGGALAAEPTPSEISVARRLFQEGRALEEAARWRDAASKFRQATAIKDTPGMRFHLARCEEEQGALVEALVEYDRARELIDSGTRAPDVERLLAAARERVRGRVALLTLRLPEALHNVSLEVDGKALSTSVLGAPLPINPGKHQLRAAAPGRKSYAEDLQLGSGELREVTLDLPAALPVPLAAPAPAPAPKLAATVARAPAPVPLRSSSASSDSASPARTIVLVSEATLFAAGLGAGIGFTLSHGSADDRYRTANQSVLDSVGGSDEQGVACASADPPPACSELEQARQDRDRAAQLATGAFIAAGASAVAFGLTWWLWPHRPPALRVGAAAQPQRVDLAISGRF
jgi:hypothetical protein